MGIVCGGRREVALSRGTEADPEVESGGCGLGESPGGCPLPGAGAGRRVGWS